MITQDIFEHVCSRNPVVPRTSVIQGSGWVQTPSWDLFVRMRQHVRLVFTTTITQCPISIQFSPQYPIGEGVPTMISRTTCLS